MDNIAAHLKRGISRQFSMGSMRRSLTRQITRQSSLDPRRNNMRFSFGRQSSMDPIRRSPVSDKLTVPENLDSTMQLLFMASRGDVKGVEELLDEGIDVNSIDLDGRTALHIAACEGHEEVVKLLLQRKANMEARDRWGSTAAADAKYYGNVEVYNILKARGAKVPGSYQVAKWNGTKVSVKILHKESLSDPDTIDAFKHELTILEKVRHPNVIQFVGAVTQNLPMMIVLEYHPKGDFGSYLQRKGRLSPSKVLRFSLDIARGMNYLHECKPDPIIHGDLRPKNILLDSGGQLKLTGFGLVHSSKISPGISPAEQPAVRMESANFYMAPEVYKGEMYDRCADAYSFGVILYEMIEGVHPFHPKSPEEVVKLMCCEGKRPPFKVKARSYPPDLRELIDECWNPKPLVRPTFSEIIVRLDKIASHGSKYGWWKDTFKFPWR
ncbi:integrin-linked protein kinase 1-like isoform X2 [Mangifera indica]|uniref:integrin-linked protein kinase 1-like isoform X2 n=1 Tax=Mangifera indica TaxID=29780 RepID=UPI001CF97485|nr:integrin-linked protein kinase 1-like isoform X2 [Mangifera indica]